MKKKTATLVVGVLFAALLQAGCGGEQEATDSTISAEQTATPQN